MDKKKEINVLCRVNKKKENAKKERTYTSKYKKKSKKLKLAA